MRNGRFTAFITICACFVLVPHVSLVRAGTEFRSFDAIPSPYESVRQVDVTKEGYQAVAAVQNVPDQVVHEAVQELFSAWNTPRLASKLSRDLPNRQRIIDSMSSSVPKHLKLRVLAVQNPRTVEQYSRPHPSGDGSYQLLSKVSVSVRSEVADSIGLTNAFQRADGTSEYLITIIQKVSV